MNEPSEQLRLILNEKDETYGEIDETIRQLTEKHDFSEAELSNSAYVLAAAGFGGHDIIDALPVVAGTAEDWLIQVDFVADWLSTLVISMNGDASDFRAVADLVTRMALLYPVTPQQVYQILERAIPTVVWVNDK